MNILNEHAELRDLDGGKTKMKSKDAVSGIISGLRWVYREAGHTDVWAGRVNEDGSKLLTKTFWKGTRKSRVSEDTQ